MHRLRASPIASTSQLPIAAIPLRGAKQKAFKSTGKSPAEGKVKTTSDADKREAYYARMNVVQDNRVLEHRDALYGLRLDPAKKTAYDDKRAKALAEATPGGREVYDTIIDARLRERWIKRTEEEERAKRQFAALQKALKDLERVDPIRFRRSVARPTCDLVRDVDGDFQDKTGRLPGLFPRQLRVPSYTPGATIFDDQWTRPDNDVS